MMTTFLLPLLIGVVGPASHDGAGRGELAARLGWLNLGGTGVAFLRYAFTPWILTLLALGELVTDQLPTTPSRTVPIQFGARIITGALSGAAIGAAGDALPTGLAAGIVGAVIGTLGGRFARGSRPHWAATAPPPSSRTRLRWPAHS